MKREDIEVGAAAGLCVAVPLYVLFTMRESDGSPNPLTPDEAFVLLLALAGFVAAALLLQPLGRWRVFRAAWLWVPVFGSVFAALAASCLGLVRDAETLANVWLFLSLWTMPAAAVVHFSGPALGWFRKWRAESPADLSIAPRS